jgi:hypothetical protein
MELLYALLAAIVAVTAAVVICIHAEKPSTYASSVVVGLMAGAIYLVLVSLHKLLLRMAYSRADNGAIRITATLRSESAP